MFQRQVLLLMLPLISPMIAAAQEVPAYRWQREIELPSVTKTALVTVPLDTHFFEQTRQHWPDVRLRNEQGQDVASIIRMSKSGKSRSVRQYWVAEQRTARVSEAKGLQVEFDLKPNEPLPSGIRIVTPLRDFEHQVQVESSADGQSWKSAGPSTLIFDYTRHVDARNDLVALIAGEGRRFRITIADLTAEQDLQLLELQRQLRGGDEVDRTERTMIARRPFRIDRIEFYRDDAQLENGEVRTMVYPTSKFVVSEKTKDRQTLLQFATQREPITGIKIITADDNFSRTATVGAELGDANDTEWRSVATDNLTRLAVGSIQREKLTIHIPEQRATNFRVVIENRDSPPLAIAGVELSGPVYELSFLASPGEKFWLEYGSADASERQYDTVALQAALAQGQVPVTAMLQEPQPNLKAPLAPTWRPLNDNRVLISCIVFLTLLLGWGLFGASRRLDEASTPK